MNKKRSRHSKKFSMMKKLCLEKGQHFTDSRGVPYKRLGVSPHCMIVRVPA